MASFSDICLVRESSSEGRVRSTFRLISARENLQASRSGGNSRRGDENCLSCFWWTLRANPSVSEHFRTIPSLRLPKPPWGTSRAYFSGSLDPLPRSSPSAPITQVSHSILFHETLWRFHQTVIRYMRTKNVRTILCYAGYGSAWKCVGFKSSFPDARPPITAETLSLPPPWLWRCSKCCQCSVSGSRIQGSQPTTYRRTQSRIQSSSWYWRIWSTGSRDITKRVDAMEPERAAAST